MFLNNNINNNKISDEISGKKEIYYTFEFLDDKLSVEFKKFFEGKKSLTINKITNLFTYFLRLIFDKIIKEVFNEYQIQEEDIEEIKKNKIKKFFIEENHLITKEQFRNAIRLLISLYLFKEDEKENKIKNNVSNIYNYLYMKDIWIGISTNKTEFKEELKEIKKLNIQINEMLSVYDLIASDEDKHREEKYYEDVINEIEKRKNEEEEKEEEEEEEEEENEEKEEFKNEINIRGFKNDERGRGKRRRRGRRISFEFLD